MRGAAAVAVFLLLATSAVAAERWSDAYNRGLKAINSGQYEAAASAFQTAIEGAPAESHAARVRNAAMVYLPHYWLGVAKFHLGDVDGALREWKISEEQGAIARTEYYGRLQEWISKANSAKKRGATDAAAESKKAADTAVSAALSAQVAALSAGADRSDSYRAAAVKLQEARTAFAGAGTDVAAFQRVAQNASTARDLFIRAAEDARKQRASRPAVASKAAPSPAQTATVASRSPAAAPVVPEPVAAAEPARVAAVETQAPPPAAAEILSAPAVRPAETSAALVAPTPVAVAATPSSAEGLRSQLESAYRFYASGDFEASERALNSILDRTRSGEAYLLRGCARYTRALLSRAPDSMLESASSDFKTALKLNRNLRLDKRAFSPKLVEFFESVRKSS